VHTLSNVNVFKGWGIEKEAGLGGLSGREPTLASSQSSLAVGDELHHPDSEIGPSGWSGVATTMSMAGMTEKGWGLAVSPVESQRSLVR
jgi:hypothetical protein